MKKQKQAKTSKTKPTAPSNQTRCKSATPLAQVVVAFLEAKAASYRPATLGIFRYVLGKHALALGSSPIGAITESQLRQVIGGNISSPSIQKFNLAYLKTFFTWSRIQGYLPPHKPTPVHGIQVRIPVFKPAILLPADLKSLLGGTNEVQCILYLAISAFSGIRHGELARLSWDLVIPGKSIILPRELSMGRTLRQVPILPVLDAWLRPFYGTQGMVITSGTQRPSLLKLAQILGNRPTRHALRHSYGAYRHAETQNPMLTAQELGLSPGILQNHFILSVTVAAAREYFALTPEVVGITNWPEKAARYLNQRGNQPGGTGKQPSFTKAST